MTAGDEDIRAVGADVDLEELRRDVRADVDRKREAGQYPQELVSPSEPDEREQRDDALLTALAHLKRSANFTSQVTTESRKPVIGPAVAKSRQLIRTTLSWYINGILSQLRTFARHVEESILVLADRTKATDERVAALEAEVRELRARLESERAPKPRGGARLP